MTESTPSPIPEQTPESISPQNTSALKQIRTYEGDMAEAIKRQNDSLVSIQQAEVRRKEARRALGAPLPEAEKSDSGSRALIMALATIIMLGAGGIGAYFAWSSYSKKIAPPIIQIPPNQLINSSVTTRIDASTMGRQELLGTVSKEKGKLRESSEIEHLDLRRGNASDSEVLDTSGLLTRLAARAPNSLVRAFDNTFMLGILGSSPSHTFLIIKLDSFESAFPGMLDWESKFAEDLLPLISGEVILDGIPLSAEFSDITIQNQDARVFKDNRGSTVLLYAFFDNELLIITDNEESLRTLIGRLESQKLIR